MRSGRLGCLSGTGLIAAVVTALVIAGFAYAKGGLLYNPGPLNAQSGEPLGGVISHAEIGGDCKACHTAPWESARMEDRCVDCHGGIAVQMQDVATVHGSMLTGKPDLRCRFCHPEHRGADAKLTEMDGNAFPHEVVGFSLKGHQFKIAGEAFACSDCHADDITRFDLQTCDTCHLQMDLGFATAHALSFGSACLECHDGVDGLVTGLDHDRYTFKLTGGHAGLDCVKCHVDARTRGDFINAFQDCYSCHFNDEPHEGRYGKDCAVCHSVDGWTPAKFDHNLSVFKLEGKHIDVACESCHQTNAYIGTPTDCYSCHRQDDEHNGQYGTDCAACHNPADWEDADFDHNRSNFPLTGAHVNLVCEKCHSSGQFAGLGAACVSCHDDPVYHIGMFTGQACSQCHTTSSWQPASYNGPHIFPMNHGEGNNTCGSCHQPTMNTWTCYTCHDQAETAAEHREEGISNFRNCLECHPTGEENEGGNGGGDGDD